MGASEGHQFTNMIPKYHGLSQRYQDTVSSLMDCALCQNSPTLKNKGENNANESNIVIAYGPVKCMHKGLWETLIVPEGLTLPLPDFRARQQSPVHTF